MTSRKSILSWLGDYTIFQCKYFCCFSVELNIFNNCGSKWVVCSKLTVYVPQLMPALTHFISVHRLYFNSISSESLMPQEKFLLLVPVWREIAPKILRTGYFFLFSSLSAPPPPFHHPVQGDQVSFKCLILKQNSSCL